MDNSIDNNKTTGILYIVPTPLGNLEDMTFRSINTLKESDYILAEDTRHSLKLLNHYNISKTLYSYYKDCEKSKVDKIIKDLLNGFKISLISDAGTPGISDPGCILIKEAISNNITVSTLPGACALIPSIVSSGFDTTHFYFYGFLNTKKNKKKTELKNILKNNYPTIIYEAPHRILETLELISELDDNRKLSIARELTKMHEEYIRGTASEILSSINPKGEMVLVIDKNTSESFDFSNLSLEEHFNYYFLKGFSKKDSIKQIAKDLNVSKNEIYSFFNKD